MTVKQAAKKQAKKRIDVYTKIYFDFNCVEHKRGEICDITDVEELEHLTNVNAIKSQYVAV